MQLPTLEPMLEVEDNERGGGLSERRTEDSACENQKEADPRHRWISPDPLASDQNGTETKGKKRQG